MPTHSTMARSTTLPVLTFCTQHRAADIGAMLAGYVALVHTRGRVSDLPHGQTRTIAAESLIVCCQFLTIHVPCLEWAGDSSVLTFHFKSGARWNGKGVSTISNIGHDKINTRPCCVENRHRAESGGGVTDQHIKHMSLLSIGTRAQCHGKHLCTCSRVCTYRPPFNAKYSH